MKNVKLKVISHITVSIVIILVFVAGSWLQWSLIENKQSMPTLKAESLALAKFISGVDIYKPNDIIGNEAYALTPHLVEDFDSNLFTDDNIASIIDKVSIVEPKEVEILDPLLTSLETSFQTDKRVFIYHSHARESWHGDEYTSDKNANSKETNITLLGEKLAEELALNGIGSIVSTTDYATAVPNYEWAYSYKYSRKSVKEILAANEGIEMVFDLHRDSQPRQYTTATINGEEYAQLYFIIGKRNEKWTENQAFAEKLNNKIEELYPGLSRGIWGKNANSGNGEYNQSLHSNNVLIEVGGVENTLEENYRTLKALAQVISLVAKEDESL